MSQHSVGRNAQRPGRIADAAAIERKGDNLGGDGRIVRAAPKRELERAPAGGAAVTLRAVAVGPVTIHSIGLGARGTNDWL